MPDRKPLFDTVRKMLGRGFRPSEVKQLDSLIDAYDAATIALGKDGLKCLPTTPTVDTYLDLAIPLIQQFEGYARALPGGKVQAYPDPATGGAPWTIGWGSTGGGIEKGTLWTKAQAEARFKNDVSHFGNGVEMALGSSLVSDAQLAAMVSLAYNIGLGAFKTSTLLKKHKAGNYGEARDQFLRWNRAAGKVMPGLVRRRAAEAELYRSGS